MSKKLSGYILIVFLLSIFNSGCSVNQSPPSEQTIQHVVLVWFKPNTSEKTTNSIIKETRKLKQIPGIQNLRVGLAVPSQRKIVDDSFDLGIVMSFPDKHTMDRYIQHSRHVDFVRRYVKPYVSKIIVYDIRDKLSE
jgi:hypothetical protein